VSDFRSQDPYLQKRYGLNRGGRNWKPIAALLLIAGFVWTIWSGLNHSVPEVRSDLISFQPINKNSISVRFSVTLKSLNKPHNCTLVARDYQTNIVGEKIVEFPIGTKSLDQSITIPTRIPAVSADILGCQVG
jgi:hypothetical protein